ASIIHTMKVARPVWLLLLASVVVLVLAVVFFTPLNPYAPSKTPVPTAVASKATRTPTKNAAALTAVPTEAPPALATDEAISEPTPPTNNPSAALQQGLTLRRNG